jgi:hypothetical protein
MTYESAVTGRIFIVCSVSVFHGGRHSTSVRTEELDEILYLYEAGHEVEPKPVSRYKSWRTDRLTPPRVDA